MDDLADAVLFLMENYSAEEAVNIGVDKDISINDMANLVKDVVGFEGELVFGTSKPDGTPRKLLDVSKNMTWAGQPGSISGMEYRILINGSLNISKMSEMFKNGMI